MRKCLPIICSIVLILCVLCSCGSKLEYKSKSLDAVENTVSISHSFSDNDNSEAVKTDLTALVKCIDYINSQRIEFGYDELFNVEKSIEGMFFGKIVSKHKCSAFDISGKLTKEHLFEIVQLNTKKYVKEAKTSIIKEITDKEYVLRICEIIVDTVNYHLEHYPEIDKSRVGCVLGNLKIVSKTSALDFAAVEPDLTLHLNPATANMAGLITDSDMYNVIVHETIHILQNACPCEEYDECTRRVGFSYAIPSWKLDWADCVWFTEGSAERMASLYSNVRPMTYKYMVNYIVSMDLATMFQKDMPVNYLETLSFQNNPTQLFEAFKCETDEDKEEVIKMLYGFEISYMEPPEAKQAYKEYYGVELEDEEFQEYQEKIKRPVVKLITKNYYRNLAQLLMDKSITKNDLYFMIGLFENTINFHIQFDESSKDKYNKDFISWYLDISNKFFEAFTNATEEEYLNYSSELDDTSINAGVKWLTPEQEKFLLLKYDEVGASLRISKSRF